MKKKILALSCMAALLVFGSEAKAGDSATADASAVITTPLSVSKSRDLTFGTIAPGTSAGTVTIGTGSSADRSATGGVQLVTSTHASAAFTVTGLTGATYSVSVPVSANLSDGASHSMTVSGFTTDHSAGTTLPATGGDPFTVGGTLNVAAGQAAGTYSGSFAVNVSYN
ncbi:MAG: DUF4402 domain-containing protein [Chlorobiaceae bacterium]|nr:DUF4402 domain-containing protein [Chlorobiaceae bacterium]